MSNDLQFLPTLIRASAGTGKTYQLTNRAMSLLFSGVPAEKILASTFTVKAAAEIRERLFKRLAEAALSEATAKELAEALNLSSVNSSRCLEVLTDLVSVQHRLSLCTLDSLFITIARSFSLELGLQPTWSIIDDAEDEELKATALGSLISSSDNLELSLLIRLMKKGLVRRSIFTDLISDLSALHGLFKESAIENWDLNVNGKKLKETELASLRESLFELELPKTQKGEPRKNWRISIEKDSLSIAENSLKSWQQFIKDGIAAKLLQGETNYDRTEISEDFIAIYQRLISHASYLLLTSLKEQTRATAEFLSKFHHSYFLAKLEQGKLSFSDVGFLLSTATTLGGAPELYYRLDTKYQHLLLDEFQDTSREQWKVLQPMVEEVLSKSGTDYSYFCVGDTKQAIYAWRGGVAEIFDALSDNYHNLHQQTLDKSFRSSPVVIDFVNQVFTNIAENTALAPFREAAISWQEQFLTHQTAREELAGYVSLIEIDGGKNKREKKSAIFERTVALTAELTESALDSGTTSIAILVRNNKSVAELIYLLKLAGITASEEGGNSLDDSVAVTVLLAALTFADHPGDSTARFILANSPLAETLDVLNESQAAKASNSLRTKLIAEGLGKTLFGLAEVLKPNINLRDLRRVSQLIELAYGFESKNTVRPEEFVRYVRRKKVEALGIADVRVMTIHKSKGLEFDAVILPELNESIAKLQSNKDLVLVKRDSALDEPSQVFRNDKEMVLSLSAELFAVHQAEKQARAKESLNLLYVALTRAKHALYLLTSKTTSRSEKSASFAGVLKAAVSAGESESENIFEAGDKNWVSSLKPETKTSSETTKPITELKFTSDKKRVRALYRKIPSEIKGEVSILDGKGESVSNKFIFTGVDARKRGTALHQMFEQISWLDEQMPSEQELAAFGKEFVEEFLILLQQPELKATLSRSQFDKSLELELFRELPFAVLENDCLVQGVMDRVVIGRNADEIKFIEVLDYKSDSVAEGDEVENFIKDKVNYYRPQLDAYKSALVQMFNVPESLVTAKIIFLSCGRVERVCSDMVASAGA
jgi:ATP-dependent exoDNAse (exonuclease V) beta subunit